MTAIRDPVADGTLVPKRASWLLRGRAAPAGWYSSFVGWGARRPIPQALRRPVYGAFARLVGADLAEAEHDLSAYPTFGEFFARRLRSGARAFELGPDEIASPCDGTLAVSGEIDDGTLVQAKGRTYRIEELLVDAGAAARYAGGWYCTIYLSPADYHRVHAPVGGTVVSYDYVPGTLWPVSKYFVRYVDGLFARNERAVVNVASPVGPVAVVLVGAIGVGNLYLAHAPSPDGGNGEPGSDSRAWRADGELRRIEVGAVPIERGAELGAFWLGSTVVMVFPPGTVRPAPIAPGEAVRCGQSLGRLVATAARGGG